MIAPAMQPDRPLFANRADADPPVNRGYRWALIMLAVYCVGVLPSLGQSLVETHAHRQTQTAYTALLYAEGEIDLLRPPLPILGPPGSIPQELPVFQAAGALVMRLGVPADAAMRLVGLATFLIAAWLLYLLARRLMGTTGALVGLGAFVFNPLAWVYGRTSLIEYLAVAGGIGFLYFAIRWMETDRVGHWALALVAGLVAILVKITTGGFLLLPALFWRSPSGRWGFQRPSIWGLLVLTVAVGLAWSAYAQEVREETPASAFLSMENQLAWFFGLAGQRFDPATWRVPLIALLSLTGCGFLVWGPLAVARSRRMGQRSFLLSFLALIPLMPLVLFNLYAIHDYYWVAVAPMVAVGIGLGFQWLADHFDRRWVKRVAVGLVGAWIATIIGMTSTWTIIYGTPAEEDGAMRIASFIREHSEPDDWVVLKGWGWNSTFLYYAARRGLAVPEENPILAGGGFGLQDISEIDFDALLADPVFGPVIFCDREARCVVEDDS